MPSPCETAHAKRPIAGADQFDGRVAAIHGALVDLAFQDGLPPIDEAVEIADSDAGAPSPKSGISSTPALHAVALGREVRRRRVPQQTSPRSISPGFSGRRTRRHRSLAF
jgi:hypothetical protein